MCLILVIHLFTSMLCASLFLFLCLSASCVLRPASCISLSVIRPISSQSGIGSQFFCAIGFLPGEAVDIAASEVSECGCLFIYWAAQIERFDDAFRRKVEV